MDVKNKFKPNPNICLMDQVRAVIKDRVHIGTNSDRAEDNQLFLVRYDAKVCSSTRYQDLMRITVNTSFYTEIP